jgi:hypothetical protein
MALQSRVETRTAITHAIRKRGNISVVEVYTAILGVVKKLD